MRNLLQKKNERTGYFGREISLDTVSIAGMYINDFTENWKLAGSILSRVRNRLKTQT